MSYLYPVDLFLEAQHVSRHRTKTPHSYSNKSNLYSSQGKWIFDHSNISTQACSHNLERSEDTVAEVWLWHWCLKHICHGSNKKVVCRESETDSLNKPDACGCDEETFRFKHNLQWQLAVPKTRRKVSRIEIWDQYQNTPGRMNMVFLQVKSTQCFPVLRSRPHFHY